MEFTGDYNNIFESKKETFLGKCSALLAPVTCEDVRPGFGVMAVDLHGTEEELNAASQLIMTKGFKLDGFSPLQNLYECLTPCMTSTNKAFPVGWGESHAADMNSIRSDGGLRELVDCTCKKCGNFTEVKGFGDGCALVAQPLNCTKDAVPKSIPCDFNGKGDVNSYGDCYVPKAESYSLCASDPNCEVVATVTDPEATQRGKYAILGRLPLDDLDGYESCIINKNESGIVDSEGSDNNETNSSYSACFESCVRYTNKNLPDNWGNSHAADMNLIIADDDIQQLVRCTCMHCGEFDEVKDFAVACSVAGTVPRECIGN